VVRGALIIAIGVLGLVAPARAAVKVACVGDSITVGVGTTAGNAYPAVLGRLLGTDYEVRNFGNSGKTMMKAAANMASYWDTATFTQSQAYAPDVVLIMLGTNDSKTANWRGGNNAYEADYRAMIARYAALASKPRLYLMLPPPAVAASFTISPAVIAGEIVPLVRRLAGEARVGLVDVHGSFQPDPRKYFGAGDGADIGDGVHPNNAGAARIAMAVARALATLGDAGADAALDGPALADAGGAEVIPEGTPDLAREAASPDGPGDLSPSLDASPGAARDAAGREAMAPPREDPGPAPVRPQGATGCHCAVGSRAGAPVLALALGVLVISRAGRRARSRCCGSGPRSRGPAAAGAPARSPPRPAHPA
jgi:acyl-CoA thioesterase I